MNKKVLILITGIIVIILLIIGFVFIFKNKKIIPLSSTAKIAPKTSDLCTNIGSINTIKIIGDFITLDFLNVSAIKTIDLIDQKGQVKKMPVTMGKVYTLKTGQTLKWGDGDFAAMNLELLELKGKKAKIKVTQNIIMPDKSTQSTSMSCTIDEVYPPKDTTQ
jgi:hypothetical protein